MLHSESGDMLTREPIQDQDTIKQKREAGNLASTRRNPEDRNRDRQTDTEMHACYRETRKKKYCSFILMSEDTMGQTIPQDGFWVKSLNKE